MNGFSRIFILGRLGSEPAMQVSKNGQNFTRLSIATHRATRETDKQEAETERESQITDWYSVNVWGRQAETCAKYLKKGQGVMVEGYLSNFQSVKEDGSTFKKVGINAMKVEFLDRKHAEIE
jgi:single-strand DNA-binding protein